MVKHATLILGCLAQAALLVGVAACNGDDSGDATATDGATTTTTTTTSSTTEPETTTSTSTTTTTSTTTSTTAPETTGTTTGGEAADAFRFTEIFVRDPHFYIVPLIGCEDITDKGPLGQPSINEQFNDAVQSDAGDPMDGMLDLNFLLLFRPLDQGAPGSFEFATGDCTAPIESTSCDIKEGTSPSGTKYSVMDAGVCLEPVAGELSPNDYSPKPGSTNAPCFKGDPLSFTLDLGDFQLPFIDAEVAAQFVGDPADQLVEGVMRGFLTEETANATLLPMDLPIVGGKPIASLLPGGEGCCAMHDDRDINNGASGWWFYIEFKAARVPYTGP